MLKPIQPQSSDSYRGRFAPTPSGPLHFGSLVAALGSFLDARAHHGQWLVRIEDVDKTRAVPDADTQILKQLEAHNLHWDETVIYQSQRDDVYARVLADISAQTYQCDCSRKQIRAQGEYYTGYCRTRQPRPTPYAIRFKNDNAKTHLFDRRHQYVEAEVQFAQEDFILRRRDGLFAYQLAVVVDDLAQGITDIVRGSDLLIPSFWQATLWQTLGGRTPRWLHLPLVTDPNGRKLSKQNHAPAIDATHPIANLIAAAKVLSLSLGDANDYDSVDAVLTAAILQWQSQWQMIV
ncbi:MULTISPECIES: tRNA glutamyl-Q(34) synthetase GluQRS [Idiomarina]|uniref:Glutamyl-Q tRNA(Asp) synthetase n=1 Tax=Idiomarina baltica OS145 TaxID=314276 RepID=A0ABM9WN13_9GAMM|nr:MULTISPECIES: tRNA glutamyl-Q(34) synthetase GluQRS [Idiomarina]EAQ32371.1 Glutamyl-tRNA synthetase related protein [Idiomarina baltica OS145]KXS36147.1 MAG: glutamyl-tRNA synthetase [Idiomarina sp. T82-3]MAF74382.1 tRNA glutamyl-Q(34) synthetase GluQRS [Idiomarinaceae bacterium]MBR37522.1 tRNA glutamyl-Q(34) synthetase GluQRS [Idiomarina sp.]